MPKKSGILVFCEGKAENERNATVRVLKLRFSRVKESVSYDHVGVRATLYDEDVAGLEDRACGLKCTHCGIQALAIPLKSKLSGTTGLHHAALPTMVATV